MDRDGTVCVSDFYNARVQRFSPDGEFLSSFGVLPNPGGLAADRDANLYLTHFSAMKLKEEPRPDGSPSTRRRRTPRQWGRTGTGDGGSIIPAGSR